MSLDILQNLFDNVEPDFRTSNPHKKKKTKKKVIVKQNEYLVNILQENEVNIEDQTEMGNLYIASARGVKKAKKHSKNMGILAKRHKLLAQEQNERSSELLGILFEQIDEALLLMCLIKEKKAYIREMIWETKELQQCGKLSRATGDLDDRSVQAFANKLNRMGQQYRARINDLSKLLREMQPETQNLEVEIEIKKEVFKDAMVQILQTDVEGINQLFYDIGEHIDYTYHTWTNPEMKHKQISLENDITQLKAKIQDLNDRKNSGQLPSPHAEEEVDIEAMRRSRPSQPPSAFSTAKPFASNTMLRKKLKVLQEVNEKIVAKLVEIHQQREEMKKHVDPAIQAYIQRQESREGVFLTKLNKLMIEISQIKEMIKTIQDEREEKLRVLGTFQKDMVEEKSRLECQRDILEEQFKETRRKRKVVHNELETLKGAIRVFCRVRPMSSSELKKGYTEVVHVLDEFTIAIPDDRRDKVHEFAFDLIFDQKSTQEQVFSETVNLCQSAMDGYNVCLFAYGQTGAGKSFTLIGNEDNPGIAPRCFTQIFELVGQQASTVKTDISCYMIELYNDMICDLLKGKPDYKDKMEIKSDQNDHVYLPDILIKKAKRATQLKKLFDEGCKNRMVASTNMNTESSRSHLIFTIVIKTQKGDKEVTGKFSIIDLAGSERTEKSKATHQQKKEANYINMSLTALGSVIQALVKNERYIPYRSNKLTELMRDSLGGNAKTQMFVNCSPADHNAFESITSMRWANRVKNVKNKVRVGKNDEKIKEKLLMLLYESQKTGKVDESFEIPSTSVSR